MARSYEVLGHRMRSGPDESPWHDRQSPFLAVSIDGGGEARFLALGAPLLPPRAGAAAAAAAVAAPRAGTAPAATYEYASLALQRSTVRYAGGALVRLSAGDVSHVLEFELAGAAHDFSLALFDAGCLAADIRFDGAVVGEAAGAAAAAAAAPRLQLPRVAGGGGAAAQALLSMDVDSPVVRRQIEALLVDPGFHQLCVQMEAFQDAVKRELA